MGGVWSTPEEDRVSQADTPTLVADMHQRYTAMARMDHWSVVEWYRPLTTEGLVTDRRQFDRPLLVVPAAGGGEYRLLDKDGQVERVLVAAEVAEFEDTLFCDRVLEERWTAALERARGELGQPAA